VFRVSSFEEAEEALLAQVLDGRGAGGGLNSDLHGSAEYRAHLSACWRAGRLKLLTLKRHFILCS
jgi:carbon-monoxide dehydrogenase medium subunit